MKSSQMHSILWFSTVRLPVSPWNWAFFYRAQQPPCPYKFRSRRTESSMNYHDIGHFCFGRRIHTSGHSDYRIFSSCCASYISTWENADHASAACPSQSGSRAITSITFAAVICDADKPCSVNTAWAPESSFTMSHRRCLGFFCFWYNGFPYACLKKRSFTWHCSCLWCLQLSPCILNDVFVFLVIRINRINSPSNFWHTRVSVSRLPIPVFLFSERLFQSWTTLQAIHDPVEYSFEIVVSLLPDHTYSCGGVSFNNVNLVKPVHESDRFRSPSTFQWSSIRFSCATSKSVCVDLITSMYFSGTGMTLLLARIIELSVQYDDGKWSLLE